MPVASSRPRTCTTPGAGVGYAEPTAILMLSAVRSPMAIPYARRMCCCTAPSMSKPPTRSAFPVTTPPIEITAISLVPPPMSTTRLPTGSWIGRPAPIAAASGSSTSATSRAPADAAASSTARRSTSVMADGTHTSTRGFVSLLMPTRFRMSRIIRCVMSKSVIAPCRSGRTATTFAGVRPIMSHASSPMARTSPLRWFNAMTVGSLNTIPSPSRKTSVFAVPRSIARFLMRSGPVDPFGLAGDERLLLPDRHVLLDAFDPVPACLERVGAMRSRARDRDGDVPDVEPAGAVQERDLTDGPLLEDLPGDLVQPSLRQLFPCFVVETGDLARFGVVAYGPDEQADSA